MKSKLKLASDAFKLAFELNLDPELDGDPCRTAFRSANLILIAEYGQEKALAVFDLVVDCEEYKVSDIKRIAKACD